MAGWMLESFDGGIDFSIPVLLIGGLHRLLTDEGDAAGDSRGISTGEDGALTESSSSPQTSFVDDNSTSESNGGGGGRKGIGPYDSTGFIVWYCLLFLCCGLPFLCGVLSYTCYRIRKMRSRRRRGVAFGEEEEEEDFVSSMFYAWERGRLGRNREELEIEREILRIEANVTAFAMKEQKRRKEALLKSWGDCRMTVAEKDLRREPLTDTDDCSDGSCSLDIENGQKLLLALPPTAKDGASTNGRRVSPFCAVCLGRYDVGDAVVWSTNPECCHVFHEECIATWLMTKQNPLCPCCRQTFAEAKERPNTEPSSSPTTAAVLADLFGGSMEEMEENERTEQQVPEQNEQSNEQNLQDRELREEPNNENNAHSQVDGYRDVEMGTHTMDAENAGRPEAPNDGIANSSELSI